MEIDPRLRSDTSSGSKYPPLHRASSSSGSPALAPNPAHHALSNQYQLGHEGSHQSIYPSPQTPGNPNPNERPGSAHDDTPDDSGAHDPKRPRACEACRGLKVRCELDINNSSGPCKRCTKANRNCVVTVPSRKRQKKTDSRVAELEKKIDALTASLHASKSGPLSAGHGSEAEVDHDIPSGGGRPNHYEQVTNGGYGVAFNSRQGGDSWSLREQFLKSSETDGRPVPPPMVIAGQKRKHQDGHSTVGSTSTTQTISHSDPKPRPTVLHPFLYSEFPEDAPAQRPNPSNQYADVIDRGIINMEKATLMFNRYTNEMAPQLPAVIFPLGTTAADVRKSKPTLFLAVLCAGSGTDHPEIQRVLTKEVMHIYADRIICHGEKTLELVQALLVSTIWYWPPEHFEELKFYQLTHIAAVMGLDINIGKKSKGPKSKMAGHGLWRDHPWRRGHSEGSDTLDAKRAWLSCYFICSASAMGLRRPNLIRWSSYMADCIEVLESSPDAAPSDRFLCQWVRNQRIAEEVSTQFQMDDPCAIVNIADPKVQYAMKGFERDLEHWSTQVPKDLRTPTLKVAEHIVNLYMHEVAMHVDHNVEEFKPPFTEESIRSSGLEEEEASRPLTSAHIAALSTCLTSIDGAFEAFLSLDVDTIRTLPILYFVRIAYAVVVLIKMFFAATKPNSELGKVIDKDNMKVESYLDGLLEKFRATAADDKSRPAAKFLMVLVMLKTWFHRSKGGKSASVKADPLWQHHSNADGEARAQTPASSSTMVSQPVLLAQQQQPEYSPANTPLQLLSEVATGSTPRPGSRNQYSTTEWHQNNQVPQTQQQLQQQPSATQQASFNFNDTNSTNQLPSGYNMMYGPVSNIDPTLSIPQDFDFSIGDGFEQAMGITLGDGDFGKYFQDDALWGVMMDSVGGMNNGFEAP